MKITKYVHSCLLIETDGLAALIDPGGYSWESHLLNPNKLPELSHIIITHEHGDHFHEPALRALSQRFAHAVIMTNNDLAKNIKGLNLRNPIASGSEDDIMVFEAAHEPLPLKTPIPLNIGVHIKDKFTHPGDALDIKTTRDILALPVSAPGWTNLRITLDYAIKLKPKIILPVHDWHWHQQARKEQYDRITKWLAPHKIEFIKLENAETIEL